MNHVDHLASLYELGGRFVVDVGAGDGGFARQLAARGAHVAGIEIDDAKVERARIDLPAGVTILKGRGEALPLDAGTQDLACFIFSLHHVPIERHDRALAEVERVLKPDGHLHVVDPLAEGSMFEVARLVEDETFVRTKSHERMRQLPRDGRFELIASSEYAVARRFADIEALIKGMVAIDPARSSRLPQVRERLERAFRDNAVVENGSYRLEQPCVAYHFRRQGS